MSRTTSATSTYWCGDRWTRTPEELELLRQKREQDQQQNQNAVSVLLSVASDSPLHKAGKNPPPQDNKADSTAYKTFGMGHDKY